MAEILSGGAMAGRCTCRTILSLKSESELLQWEA